MLAKFYSFSLILFLFVFIKAESITYHRRSSVLADKNIILLREVRAVNQQQGIVHSEFLDNTTSLTAKIHPNNTLTPTSVLPTVPANFEPLVNLTHTSNVSIVPESPIPLDRQHEIEKKPIPTDNPTEFANRHKGNKMKNSSIINKNNIPSHRGPEQFPTINNQNFGKGRPNIPPINGGKDVLHNINILPNTTVIKDAHDYYSYIVINDSNFTKNFFRDLDEEFAHSHAVHPLLSDQHRVAVQMKLSFNFRFYGTHVPKITLATGGFIYMSDFLHKYLTYTQYIAPLMGDFDTTISNSSKVKYADTGEKFIVVWQNIHLQHNPTDNGFTFQVVLYKNGTILFAYRQIPFRPILRSSLFEVGLSDAYYQDDPHNLKRKIIEYHRVEIDKRHIQENMIIILTPFPTCIEQSTCEACIFQKAQFNCSWCSSAQRCSSGTDRLKQDWEQRNCHLLNTKDECPLLTRAALSVLLFCILLFLSLFSAAALWVYYSYNFPNTRSGIWLIEHRPKTIGRRFSRITFFKNLHESEEKYQVAVNTEETQA